MESESSHKACLGGIIAENRNIILEITEPHCRVEIARSKGGSGQSGSTRPAVEDSMRALAHPRVELPTVSIS